MSSRGSGQFKTLLRNFWEQLTSHRGVGLLGLCLLAFWAFCWLTNTFKPDARLGRLVLEDMLDEWEVVLLSVGLFLCSASITIRAGGRSLPVHHLRFDTAGFLEIGAKILNNANERKFGVSQIVVALPMPALGMRTMLAGEQLEFRRAVEEFQVALRCSLSSRHQMLYVTNSPVGVFTAHSPLLRFLLTLAPNGEPGDKKPIPLVDLFVHSVTFLLRQVGAIPSGGEPGKGLRFILDEDVIYAFVGVLGVRSHAVMLFRKPEAASLREGIIGLETRNPDSIRQLVRIIESQLTGGNEFDLVDRDGYRQKMLTERFENLLHDLRNAKKEFNTVRSTDIENQSRRNLKFLSALATPRSWLMAERWSDLGYRYFWFPTKRRRASVSAGLLIVLPGVNGFRGEAFKFYEDFMVRTEDWDHLFVEYPGCSGAGEFSMDASVAAVSDALSKALMERESLRGVYADSESNKPAYFGICTGFLVASLHAKKNKDHSFRRILGWNVPERMKFTERRLDEWMNAYGLNIDRGFYSAAKDYRPADISSSLGRGDVSALRSLEKLEESIEYLEFGVEDGLDSRFSGVSHTPHREDTNYRKAVAYICDLLTS